MGGEWSVGISCCRGGAHQHVILGGRCDGGGCQSLNWGQEIPNTGTTVIPNGSRSGWRGRLLDRGHHCWRMWRIKPEGWWRGERKGAGSGGTYVSLEEGFARGGARVNLRGSRDKCRKVYQCSQFVTEVSKGWASFTREAASTVASPRTVSDFT